MGLRDSNELAANDGAAGSGTRDVAGGGGAGDYTLDTR